MTSMNSNDAEVVQLQEFCGVERSQAVVLLNKFKTLEAAANAFFTDPAGALKDEPPQNEWVQADNLPSFQIEADDSTKIPSMSRPPSRIDNRGTVEAAVGQQFVHQQYSQDADLQRAIAISKQEMPSQESGVTLSDQKFGPATRTHYDPSQWAVAPVASSREIFDHPPASKRRRLSSQPAFLRGSPGTGYLAPLLNIYYHIPLARQAFLSPSFRVHSYGFDPHWWSGMSDENTKSLSVEASESYDSRGQILLAELQCLMAFLSDSDRAYGSVDALSDLNILKAHESDNAFSRFFESWITANLQQDPADQLTQIFTSEARKASVDPDVDYDRKTFQVIDAPVEDSLSPTLVDLMDNIIWNDSMDDVDDVWMEQCAQVFTMRLQQSEQGGNGLELDIPPIWHPDRYMSAYKEAAREMRVEVLQLKRQLQKCDFMQRRCSTAKSGDKRVIKIRDVLEAASQLSEQMNSASSPSSLTDGSSTSIQLQAVLQRLDQKIEALEKQKRLLHGEMIRVSRNLAGPSSDHDGKGRMTYVLQGVTTKPTVTYVRIRGTNSPQLIDINEASPSDHEWQWWRIEWLEDSPPGRNMPGPQTQAEAMAREDASRAYTIRELSEQEVLRAARDEHNSAVLVYADQQAINYPDPKISAALKEFVKRDNRAFRAELDEEFGIAPPSMDEYNNNTIMDDDSGEHNKFDERTRNMTPMSTNSFGLDQDESTLRPFSNDDAVGSTAHDVDDQPPSYEDSGFRRSMDPNVSKIGVVADQMLDKCISDDIGNTDGPVHIEHSQTPLR